MKLIFSKLISFMEFNPFQRKFRKGEKRVALVYPNRYVGGIANLGLQILYAKINEFAHCERFYFDVFDGLRSLETGTPLSEFELALFSLQYEIDYFNAIQILKKSDFQGLKIAGGPCVMENPKPLMEYFDAFFIGEAEKSIEEILSAKTVTDLEGIKGIFTGKEERVKRVYYPLEKHIEKEIIGEGAYGRSFLIEIGRGCIRKCSFCIVRQIYFPPRWRKIEDLVEVKNVKKIALIAPSPTDHPQFKNIVQNYAEKGFEISPSSLRADAIDEELVEILKSANVKTLTLAPETASEVFAEFLRKDISFEDLKRAIEISSGSFEKLKLYYLIGLPNENIEDVKKIVEQIKLFKRFIPRIEISVNPLVPKPHTPLQWLPFANLSEIRKKILVLKNECRKNGIEFNPVDPKEFATQTILSRGDESVSKMLESRNYRSFEDFLLGIDIEKELPWDFIDHGYKKSKLVAEFQKLMDILDKTYKSSDAQLYEGR
ncbi:MAG: radical SAM protein [Archaeoglobaceae archaeon]